MKLSLWIAVDNFGRMYYTSGSKADIKRFIKSFGYNQKLYPVELKGEIKNV